MARMLFGSEDILEARNKIFNKNLGHISEVELRGSSNEDEDANDAEILFGTTNPTEQKKHCKSILRTKNRRDRCCKINTVYISK